jgi:hypothetical protein
VLARPLGCPFPALGRDVKSGDFERINSSFQPRAADLAAPAEAPCTRSGGSLARSKPAPQRRRQRAIKRAFVAVSLRIKEQLRALPDNGLGYGVLRLAARGWAQGPLGKTDKLQLDREDRKRYAGSLAIST